jgi:phenolic acid decarboxylase
MSSKKFCFWLALICLFVCVFTLPKLLPVPGVSPNVQAVAQPRVIMEVLDPSLEQFSTMWRDEIGRRFDNAVGVLCHGGDFVPGEWVAGTSDQPWAHVSKMTEVVKKYQLRHPTRTVVLVACNTGHLKLGVPGVYYAASSVWCVPDRALTAGDFAHSMPRKLDDIEDFIKDLLKPSANTPTRWQIDPDCVGNIFEFRKDE